MGDQPADHCGKEDRGHAFQDIEGKLRCGHCGHTAENFRTYGNNCAVSQCLRYEEPAPDDDYAVVCWETGAGSFWRTADEAEAFRQAQPDGLWLGPLPLLSLNPTADRAATHASFEQYLLTRGEPRDARSVSVGETLTETIREVERPLTSFAECYPREDHLWTQSKQSAKEEAGHFISDLADSEPNRVLSQVACDIDQTARAAGYGAIDVVRLFNSVNLYLHIARFAKTSARHVSDDAIDRAVYWVLLNCHFYARHLAHKMDKVDGHDREPIILGGVLNGSK